MVAMGLPQWVTRAVDRAWFSSGRVRPCAALGSHGAAHPALGHRRAAHPARCASVAAAPRLTTALRLTWIGPDVPVAAPAGARPGSRSPGRLLECGDRRVHRLAHVDDVRTGTAFRAVARSRARELSWKRS